MKQINIVILCLFFTSIGYSNTYYFSNAGSDNNTGTQASPLASITKCNSVLKKGDTAFFNRGDVFFGMIAPASNITYSAYGVGAKPIITGLIDVKNWVSIGNGNYEALIPNASVNIVLLDGKIQPIGRYPKAGLGEKSYFKVKSFTSDNKRWTKSDGTISYSDTFPDFTGGELVQKTEQWVYDRAIINSQTRTSINYSFLVARNHPTVSNHPQNGHGFFFQNHINTLTTLGDWCYKNGKLTMFFGNEDPNKYKVQVAIDYLVDLTKNNVSFSGIEFNGANESIVYSHPSTYASFDSCDFYNAGVNGVDFSTNFPKTNHITVTNCNIKDILNIGVNANGVKNVTISNNHIENIGLIAGMGLTGNGTYMGIWGVSDSSLIEYNDIGNIGYSGIYYRGDNTKIQFNHIHNYCLRLSDGGGIYTYNPTGVNRVVYKNIVHDGGGDIYGLGFNIPLGFDAVNDTTLDPLYGHVKGIYNDDRSTGITITDNLSFNNSLTGISFGSTSGIVATGNTLYNNKYTQAIFADPYKELSVKFNNNILITGRTKSKVYELAIKRKTSVIDTTGNIVKQGSYRLEYNPTKETKVIDLGKNFSWQDLKGATFSDNVTLEPFSSVVLTPVPYKPIYPTIIETILKRLDKLEGKQ